MIEKKSSSLRIGTGAGYGGDRIDPAIQLMEKGNLDYIIFECLAERTIALAQKDKLKDPEKGYNELLVARMEQVLPLCHISGIKVITNMGAANPKSAAHVVSELARKLGFNGMKIAYVTGDSISDKIDKYLDNEVLETGGTLRELNKEIVSANAYIGSSGIVKALNSGADIVICGRVSDPALVLAPIIHEFGWQTDDFELIGKGILAGHLLECGAQVTGGYFADPGYKDVPDLWNVGFPIGEISPDGTIEISKLDEAGGVVNRATCTEQILYELHDPHAYITPDGIADFSQVVVEEVGKNRVKVSNGSGHPSTGKLKVSIGYRDCYVSESEFSYGGPGALDRARLAVEILEKRFKRLKLPIEGLKFDYIGLNSLYGDELSDKLLGAEKRFSEIRVRIIANTAEKDSAEAVAREVETLYLNGPAAGGGFRSSTKEQISVVSIFIPESDAEIKVHFERT